MASFVRNILTKNYQNVIHVIGFQVTVKNVGDVLLRHSVERGLVGPRLNLEPLHFYYCYDDSDYYYYYYYDTITFSTTTSLSSFCRGPSDGRGELKGKAGS